MAILSQAIVQQSQLTSLDHRQASGVVHQPKAGANADMQSACFSRFCHASICSCYCADRIVIGSIRTCTSSSEIFTVRSAATAVQSHV
jgi:hypothetical protein